MERKGKKAYMKKIMTENFPHLGKKQTSGSRKPRVTNKMNPKRLTSRHISKMSKV